MGSSFEVFRLSLADKDWAYFQDVR
jgi:hypothetical protein